MKKILSIILTLMLFATLSFATVTNTILPPKQYTGNGITTNFPITFDYVQNADISVSFVNDSDGSIDDWVLDAVGDQGYTIVSGAVVANTAPDDGTLVIDGETELTQELDLKNNRATPAELYESALDKATLQSRDNKALIDRAMVAPATADPDIDYTAPDYEASSYWQWHPTEKKLRNATISGTTNTIGTDVGDLVKLIDDGSGNAAFPAFPLSGQLDTNGHQVNESFGADIASASFLPIGSDGNTFTVTGTNNIGTISNEGVGTKITLVHAGVLDLLDSASLLLKNDGNDITVAVGDVSKWVQKTTDPVWEMTSFTRANGDSLGITGKIITWATDTPPDGYLECNGASLSRTTYPALFSVIGTLYGAASGTTFNIPDFRGRFLRSWDHGAGVDPDAGTRTVPLATGATLTAGDHVGTEQDGQNEDHDHSIQRNNVASGAGSAFGYFSQLSNISATTSGSTGGDEARPINTNVMYCIKY